MYDKLLVSAKQFLSILPESTMKDIEIKSLVDAGIAELERSGINTQYNYDKQKQEYDSLIKTAIMMFVKSNFGNVNIKEKELAAKVFNNLEQSLSLSEGYRKEESDVKCKQLS
jgi:hypothetical protein|nr:MAG TPA: hypothetical protein [Caudoviricetes sp.]